MKAIQTRYAGHRFRSRLEARWAVFFDSLNISWQYEPQGFVVGSGRSYLPDFYLPESKTWVEVKPTDSMLDWELMKACSDPANGLPDMTDSFRTTRGLLVLGPVPRHEFIEPGARVLHPVIQSKAGTPSVGFVRFSPDGLKAEQYAIADDSGASMRWHDAVPEGFVDGRILSIVSADPSKRLMWRLAYPSIGDAYAAARGSSV